MNIEYINTVGGIIARYFALITAQQYGAVKYPYNFILLPLRSLLEVKLFLK